MNQISPIFAASLSKLTAPLILGLCLLLLATAPVTAAVDRQAYPMDMPAGLEEMSSKSFDILYVKPGFQPGNYSKLIIEEPQVDLHDYWEWKNKRDITERDVQRIQTSTAKILREQFSEKFSGKNGYALAETGETGQGTLVMKPAMINLNLNAPDLSVPEHKDTFVKSAGHATLYLDLYDAASGELLLRVIDHDAAREHLRFYEGNRVTNNRDLRIMVSRWANALRKHLDALDSNTA